MDVAGLTQHTSLERDDVVYAFETVCQMMGFLRADVQHISEQMDSLVVSWPCASGWGWFDQSELWHPYDVPAFGISFCARQGCALHG